ncbi:MAG TPA: SCO family protein [Candidatus Dormibacteraeota bacterium]|nr:SCO family protein [Candidatus Dormibacteraeota bacterium]
MRSFTVPRPGLAGALGATAVLILAGCGGAHPQGPTAPSFAMQGTTLHGPAPDFTLTDQFGQPISLHQFRGKVVLLAFVDSECTTICPLTTQSMVDALSLLGPAASQVQLLGVDANPEAIDVSDVRSYSTAHGLMDRWHFVTGTLEQLQAVWRAYHIFAQVDQGQIDHTPALYVIDPAGQERYVYLTPMEYAALPQEAQILANDASHLLPSHPRVLPATRPGGPAINAPSDRVRLPALFGPRSTVELGAGESRLTVFWASWLPEAEANLGALNEYAQDAHGGSLPTLSAVDVGNTEPSSQAAKNVLDGVGFLLYPVAEDPTGRVADVYQVQDLPWLTLTNARGDIIWQHDGWMPIPKLEQAVRHALQQHGR